MKDATIPHCPEERGPADAFLSGCSSAVGSRLALAGSTCQRHGKVQ
jgi:hypothetical protein